MTSSDVVGRGRARGTRLPVLLCDLCDESTTLPLSARFPLNLQPVTAINPLNPDR